MTDDPVRALPQALGAMTQIVDHRPDVLPEAVGAIADLARVMDRLGEGC